MGAKCIPDNVSYDGVMQLNAAVKCSSDPLAEKTANGTANSPPSCEGKGKLPGAAPPATHAQTPTIKTSRAAPIVTPTTAETRSLPGKIPHSHRRKQSHGNNSLTLQTNGTTSNGDSLSSFRSTSTMSSGSIASNISQLCEKYFMQPLYRSRSLPSNVGARAGSHTSIGSRFIPYIHLRRRKGKCVRKFCMRFLPPAAACSGAVALQLNAIAVANLGKVQPGEGKKPVYPFGFSKGNNGLERQPGKNNKLHELREPVKAVEENSLPPEPQYSFFICHTEEDYVPYVDKLVKKCDKDDISVFSRSYSLLWGDSQRMDTEHAISSALYGIVLLSPALLNSYRSTWCEKDLDVLFDRNTSQRSPHNVILPIYCGGITHEQVQEKYPFFTQERLVYEEMKVDGIIKQMKLVLEKRRQQAKKTGYLKTCTSTPNTAQKEELKTVSELDIEYELKQEDIGLVCTRPTSLTIDSEKPSSSTSLNTELTSLNTASTTPSKLNGVLKSSNCSKSGVKKTLRIDPDPKFQKAAPLYRTDGVTNHCCHCGEMSSKYRGAIACQPSDIDAESVLMEQLHQTRIADDAADDQSGDEDSQQDPEEMLLCDPGKLNELLPMHISTLPYTSLTQLCYLMDPLAAAGSDFTTFAAEIGFCTTYIRYLKALDIKKNSPFEEVLKVWQDSAPDTTIGDLLYLLHEIQRNDAVHKLREYYVIS